MRFASHLKRLVRAAAGFVKADGGNVAMMFAISAVPLLGAIGAAVDYTRAVNARSAMQAAIDSTALMLAQDAPTLTAAQLTTKATSYFNALYSNHPEVTGVTVTATYTPNNGSGSTIVVTGAGNLPTDFMKIAGYPTMSIGVNSTTTWGNTRLRVAMALDVTGSMNSFGKLDAMKTAAKALIDTLRSSAKSTGDVYVSIIPFNVMVNVGTSNKNAAWLDWDTDYGSCSKSTWTRKSDCLDHSKTWTASGVSNWKGCVTDRDQSYDTTRDVPTSSNNPTLFLAKSYSSCNSNSQILPMTSIYAATDAQTVKDKIDSLVAGGNTNQAIGMHWAWMSLQATDPLNTPAKDTNYLYTDAIILLSDGLNTQDRWYSVASDIDARQKILCDNIKNKANGNTIIYTIQVNTDGDPESAVLGYCATTGNFYASTTASGIGTAFTSIGASLSKLRLAK